MACEIEEISSVEDAMAYDKIEKKKSLSIEENVAAYTSPCRDIKAKIGTIRASVQTSKLSMARHTNMYAAT